MSNNRHQWQGGLKFYRQFREGKPSLKSKDVREAWQRFYDSSAGVITTNCDTLALSLDHWEDYRERILLVFAAAFEAGRAHERASTPLFYSPLPSSREQSKPPEGQNTLTASPARSSGHHRH